jgi:hypothetical protein
VPWTLRQAQGRLVGLVATLRVKHFSGFEFFLLPSSVYARLVVLSSLSRHTRQERAGYTQTVGPMAQKDRTSMIKIIIGIGLIVLAILLFLVKNDVAMKKLAAVLGVVASIAAILVWFFPSPTQSPPTYISNENWVVYQGHSPGSLVTSLKPVIGTDRSFETSFELETNGWISIYKKISPRSLSGTSGIKFYYSGMGNPNTLEFKLIDKYETIFEAVWSGVTVTNANGPSTFWEIRYSDLRCRQYSGKCKTENDVRTLTLNPKNIDRVDFAFSNKPETGDTPGSGTVIIEEIMIIP